MCQNGQVKVQTANKLNGESDLDVDAHRCSSSSPTEFQAFCKDEWETIVDVSIWWRRPVSKQHTAVLTAKAFTKYLLEFYLSKSLNTMCDSLTTTVIHHFVFIQPPL